VYNFLYTTCTRKTKPPKSCIFSAWSRFIVRSRIDISHAANQSQFGLRLSASIPDYNAHHTLPLLLHSQLWFIVGSPIPTYSLFATLRRVSRLQVSVQSNSVCAILIRTRSLLSKLNKQKLIRSMSNSLAPVYMSIKKLTRGKGGGGRIQRNEGGSDLVQVAEMHDLNIGTGVCRRFVPLASTLFGSTKTSNTPSRGREKRYEVLRDARKGNNHLYRPFA